MPIQASDLKPNDQIYTYVLDTGINVILSARHLYEWVEANRSKLETVLTPINRAQALEYILNNIVSPERLEELSNRPLDSLFEIPMLFGLRGTFTEGRPDVLHIDGHHRYVLAAMQRMAMAPAIVLKIEQWKPFEVTGLPNISQNKLQAIPHAPRSY